MHSKGNSPVRRLPNRRYTTQLHAFMLRTSLLRVRNHLLIGSFKASAKSSIHISSGLVNMLRKSERLGNSYHRGDYVIQVRALFLRLSHLFSYLNSC